MFWIPLAIGSYFFSGLAATIDKALLSKRIPSPITYTFYTGLLSIGIVVLVPFGFTLLPPKTLLLALAAGVAFIPASYFFYVSLRRCDVSRIVPVIGGSTPIFLMIFAFVVFGKALGPKEFAAVVFFILGEVVLATEVMASGRTDSLWTHLLGARGRRLQICGPDSRKGVFAALLAALFFALTFFLSKIVFDAATHFNAAFIWTRLGSFLAAVLMLLVPHVRKAIFATSRGLASSSSTFVVFNKIIGASGFYLLNLAFKEAASQNQVIIINSLKGFEYLFVFLLSIYLTVFYPDVLEEAFDYHTVILKLAGIFLISIGFIFLV